MSGLPKEIYVVVAESDYYIKKERKGVPIAFESEALDMESAKAFQKRIGNRYGRTAIYRAVKIDEVEE